MSSESKKITINLGGGTVGLLGVAFVVLKLCNIIDWSWIWVVAPFWIPIAAGITFMILYILALLIITLFWK